jgi:hypothetical protein
MARRRNFRWHERTTKDEVEYFKSLIDESDRGCVILVACRLDDALYELHESCIYSNIGPTQTSLVDKLLSLHQPLGDFAARIQLAYAYGLVSRQDYRDLEVLRKMRNDAAHILQHTRFSFDIADIRERVLSLTAPKRIVDAIPYLRGDGIQPPPSDPKLYLINAGVALNRVIRFKAVEFLNLEPWKEKTRS